MAPSNPGGRPKKAWNASRKRKLVRLYLMTDLKVMEIQKVLEEEGFSPGLRNVQAQLSILLPDNAKEWKQYRPRQKQDGVRRLADFKRCREHQVSKYARYKSRRRFCEKSPTTRSPTHSSASLSIFYDPTRHYEETQPGSIPSHAFISSLDQLYGGNHSSRHEAPSRSGESTINPDENFYKEVATSNSGVENQQAGLVNTNGLCSVQEPLSTPDITGDHSVHSQASEESGIEPMVVASQATFTRPGLTRSNSRASSIGSSSIRTMSTRLSSRLSHSLRHVNSVLSASNSFRSSLVYAASISSGRLSTMTDASWSHEEFNAWRELVDESATEPETVHRSGSNIRSLYHRPCCGFWRGTTKPTYNFTCIKCGYSFEHYQARYAPQEHPRDRAPMNYSVTDKFGNTPLHHAAAEGNTKTILSSMLNHHISDSELAHRNTSGETFLHVFRIPPPSVHNMSSNESDFERYVKILKLASGQWFQFQIRDHYGRCVAQRLHELTNNWEVINRHHLKQVAEILGLKHNNKLVDEMSWLTAPSSAFRSDVDGYSKTRLSDLLLDCSTPPNELTAALENWPRTSLSGRPLQRLTDESDIHQRDSRGYTALTIAAGKGLREAVSLLLESGANPNTRSHQSTSVIAHATAKLAQAQKENKDDLYARVLSCIVLLSDHGAKATPTEYDEYCIFTPISKKKSTRFAPATFVKQTLGQISRNRSRTKAIKLSADSRNLGIIAEMSAVKDRVELDGWPPLSPGPAELGAEHGSSNLRRPNNGKQTWLYDIPEQVEDVSPVYTSKRSFDGSDEKRDSVIGSLELPSELPASTTFSDQEPSQSSNQFTYNALLGAIYFGDEPIDERKPVSSGFHTRAPTLSHSGSSNCVVSSGAGSPSRYASNTDSQVCVSNRSPGTSDTKFISDNEDSRETIVSSSGSQPAIPGKEINSPAKVHIIEPTIVHGTSRGSIASRNVISTSEPGQTMDGPASQFYLDGFSERDQGTMSFAFSSEIAPSLRHGDYVSLEGAIETDLGSWLQGMERNGMTPFMSSAQMAHSQSLPMCSSLADNNTCTDPPCQTTGYCYSKVAPSHMQGNQRKRRPASDPRDLETVLALRKEPVCMSNQGVEFDIPRSPKRRRFNSSAAMLSARYDASMGIICQPPPESPDSQMSVAEGGMQAAYNDLLEPLSSTNANLFNLADAFTAGNSSPYIFSGNFSLDPGGGVSSRSPGSLPDINSESLNHSRSGFPDKDPHLSLVKMQDMNTAMMLSSPFTSISGEDPPHPIAVNPPDDLSHLVTTSVQPDSEAYDSGQVPEFSSQIFDRPLNTAFQNFSQVDLDLIDSGSGPPTAVRSTSTFVNGSSNEMNNYTWLTISNNDPVPDDPLITQTWSEIPVTNRVIENIYDLDD